MKRITNSSTKAQIADYLVEVVDTKPTEIAKADKSLVDTLAYTVKKYLEDKKQVLKADLLEVALEVQEFMAPMQTELKPVEAKIKAVAKKEVKPKAKVEKEPKKVKPKAKAKKPAPVEEVKLPEVIETEDGTYELEHVIETYKDFAEAVQVDKRDLYIAEYWTPKLIRQFGYSGHDVFRHLIEEGFPENMDLRKPFYFGSMFDGVYALSIYSEAVGLFLPDTFTQVEGTRYVNGCEWGIYELVTEEEEEEAK